MEVPKNNQQVRKGDTATAEQSDVAAYMVPEVVKKNVDVTRGGESPKTGGIMTPGSPMA